MLIRVIRCFYKLILYQALASHLLRLIQAHDVQDAGSHVGQYAVLYGDALAVGDVDEGHGVERVRRVGCAVGVDGIVGVAVVGDDDGFVASCLRCLDDFAHALVDGRGALLRQHHQPRHHLEHCRQHECPDDDSEPRRPAAPKQSGGSGDKAISLGRPLG